MKGTFSQYKDTASRQPLLTTLKKAKDWTIRQHSESIWVAVSKYPGWVWIDRQKSGVYTVCHHSRMSYIQIIPKDLNLANMKLLTAIRHRKPARTLADLEVPDTVWKQDFDLADRYQGFANELMRIGLLGIGAYGFLIKRMLEGNALCKILLQENKVLMSLGASSLGLSLVLVLTHRFFSTACLYHQVLIVRSLKRLSNDDWTDQEKEQEQIFLKKTREEQLKKAIMARLILKGAAVFFGGGFIFFILMLIHTVFSSSLLTVH